MKKFLTRTLIAVFGFILLSAFAILRPVPIVTESECLTVKGVVNEIREGGENDVVFKINGDNTTYYINRGLEQQMTLEGLKRDLMGQEITMRYPEYWTPLDWNNSVRHISQVVHNGNQIWSELKEE